MSHKVIIQPQFLKAACLFKHSVWGSMGQVWRRTLSLIPVIHPFELVDHKVTINGSPTIVRLLIFGVFGTQVLPKWFGSIIVPQVWIAGWRDTPSKMKWTKQMYKDTRKPSTQSESVYTPNRRMPIRKWDDYSPATLDHDTQVVSWMDGLLKISEKSCSTYDLIFEWACLICEHYDHHFRRKTSDFGPSSPKALYVLGHSQKFLIATTELSH